MTTDAVNTDAAIVGTLQVYRIPADNMPLVWDMLAKYDKQAAKLHVNAPILNIIREETEPFFGNNEWGEWVQKGYRTYTFMTVVGNAPKIDGWKFIGVLAHEEGGTVVRSVPGETVPPNYQIAENYCDHCKTARRRIETFVLEHESGKYTQVGRNCLRDFLGGFDPSGIVASLEWLREIGERLQSDEYCGEGHGKYQEDTLYFLSHVACMIRTHGFVSAAMVREGRSDHETTVGATLGNIDCTRGTVRDGRGRKIEPIILTDEDKAIAKAAIEWAAEKIGDTTNEYLHNVKVTLSAEYLGQK